MITDSQHDRSSPWQSKAIPVLSTGAETERGFLTTIVKFSEEAVFPPSGQTKKKAQNIRTWQPINWIPIHVCLFVSVFVPESVESAGPWLESSSNGVWKWGLRGMRPGLPSAITLLTVVRGTACISYQHKGHNRQWTTFYYSAFRFHFKRKSNGVHINLYH